MLGYFAISAGHPFVQELHAGGGLYGNSASTGGLLQPVVREIANEHAKTARGEDFSPYGLTISTLSPSSNVLSGWSYSIR